MPKQIEPRQRHEMRPEIVSSLAKLPFETWFPSRRIGWKLQLQSGWRLESFQGFASHPLTGKCTSDQRRSLMRRQSLDLSLSWSLQSYPVSTKKGNKRIIPSDSNDFANYIPCNHQVFYLQSFVTFWMEPGIDTLCWRLDTSSWQETHQPLGFPVPALIWHDWQWLPKQMWDQKKVFQWS